LISIKNLTYSYPDAEEATLKGVNLAVHKGEFIAITGSTGCGKTTLCRCLNGLIPHFYGGKLTGQIIVAGLDILKHSTSRMSEFVGFVSQNPENQLFSLTVERDIAFGLENLGLPREELRTKVENVLKTLDLTDLRDKPPHELSGGQQQKVSIACVLAMEPKIMVLDEPTSLLDPMSAKNILEIIGKLNREFKITIIIIEHRLELVTPYADRIIIMDNGKLTLSGPPREIFSLDENKLEAVGIPTVTRLHRMLIRKGLLQSKVTISAKEFSDQLRRLLN